METLPWELIGVIGANLLPMWRCRLYLCCKDWYIHMSLADKELFIWHKMNTDNIANINCIDYDIIVAHKKILISRRKYNNIRSPTYSTFRIHGYLDISRSTARYEYNGQYNVINAVIEEGGSVCIWSEYNNITTYLRESAHYDEIKTIKRDITMHGLYYCMQRIYKFLDKKDFINLLFASGKIIWKCLKYSYSSKLRLSRITGKDMPIFAYW
jgi:hypothetical protein